MEIEERTEQGGKTENINGPAEMQDVSGVNGKICFLTLGYTEKTPGFAECRSNFK